MDEREILRMIYPGRLKLPKLGLGSEHRLVERLFGLREGSISGDSVLYSLSLLGFFVAFSLLLREPSLIPVGIAASLILFLSLIYLPLAFFRIRRARVLSDLMNFLVQFLTLSRVVSYDRAFEESVEGLGEEFMEAYGKYLAKEFHTVAEAVSWLAERLGEYSDAAETVLLILASELKKPSPDFSSVLNESLECLQTANLVEFNIFSESFRLSSLLLGLVPVIAYVIFPLFFSLSGKSVTLGIVSGGVFVVFSSIFICIYILTKYPSAFTFTALNPDREATRNFLKADIPDTSSSLSSRSPFSKQLLPAVLASIAFPPLLILLSVVVLWHSHRYSPFLRYVEACKKVQSTLPPYLRSVSFRLRMGEPLERAMEGFNLDMPVARLFRAEAAGRVLFDSLSLVVEKMFKKLKTSGEALSATLEGLKDYSLRILGYKDALSSQISTTRGAMHTYFFMIPAISITCLLALQKIGQKMQEVGTSSFITGKQLVGKVNPYVASPFVALSLLVCLAGFAVLQILCDEVISKEIAIAKLRTFGLGIGATGVLLTLFYFTSLFGFFGLR